MSKMLVGVFTTEDDILDATTACREAGLPIHDVYTPYAVHGMDKAMGLRRSRITWVTAIAGACAGAFALSFQIWASSIDWPQIIGGKAPNAIPAWVPITFELTVLVGGLSTMVALFFRSGLFPGKKARLVVPDITDDKFVIALDTAAPSFDRTRAMEIFARHHALRSFDDPGVDPEAAFPIKPNATTITAVFGLIVVVWVLMTVFARDFTKPNTEILNDMAVSYAGEAQMEWLPPEGKLSILPYNMVQQDPPEGTFYRGQTGYLFPYGDADKERAARELSNPLVRDDKILARGESVFRANCSPCHGLDGKGETPVTAEGRFPRPPSLHGRAKEVSDGELYFIIVKGQNNMPSYASQVAPADRWKLVHYLRSLQGK